MRPFVRRVTSSVLVCALLASLPRPAYAWGPDGHRIAAAVAERHLTQQARQGVRDLLGGDSLVAVSTWADEIRLDRRLHRARWHYVSVPRDATGYVRGRDCPDGECVVEKVNDLWKVLADRAAPREERVLALKWLVHLVGDLHQPLHISGDNRGQNVVEVDFFDGRKNVHSIWDTYILRHRNWSVPAYTYEIEARLQGRDLDVLQRGSAVDWAMEAHRVAAENAYVIPPGMTGERYYADNLRPLEDQLTRAGIRLARVLNAAFAGMPPESSVPAVPSELPPRPADWSRPASAAAVSTDTAPAPSGNGTETVPDTLGAPEDGWLHRAKEGFARIREAGALGWLAGIAGPALLGLGALVLLRRRRGNGILAPAWLESHAARLLNVAPGLGHRLLFGGYRERLATQAPGRAGGGKYFGLPARDSQGSLIPHDMTGDRLHAAIAGALGPQRPVLVTGRGGAGKSTLLARLAHLALHDQLPPLRGYLPVLVPSSFYGKSLTQAIAETLRVRDGVPVTEEVLKHQLQTRSFLVLFDGVSEVAGDRAQALDEILRTARDATFAGCRFVVASRPPEESPSGVRVLELQPLTAKVVSEMLDPQTLGTDTVNRVRKQLRSFGDRPIEPLLLDMLLNQGEQDGVLATRAGVYELYFRKLLRVEDNQDDWDGWRTALETMAWEFMLSTGKRGVGLPHERLMDRISGGQGVEALAARLRRLHALPVAGERELLSALEDAGVLLRVRSRWRFVHDTFEEYFAASWVFTHVDAQEEAPPLERWTALPDRQQEFLETVDFIREMTADARQVREVLRAGFPPLWRERLDQRD